MNLSRRHTLYMEPVPPMGGRLAIAVLIADRGSFCRGRRPVRLRVPGRAEPGRRSQDTSARQTFDLCSSHAQGSAVRPCFHRRFHRLSETVRCGASLLSCVRPGLSLRSILSKCVWQCLSAQAAFQVVYDRVFNCGLPCQVVS